MKANECVSNTKGKSKDVSRFLLALVVLCSSHEEHLRLRMSLSLSEECPLYVINCVTLLCTQGPEYVKIKYVDVEGCNLVNVQKLLYNYILFKQRVINLLEGKRESSDVENVAFDNGCQIACWRVRLVKF